MRRKISVDGDFVIGGVLCLKIRVDFISGEEFDGAESGLVNLVIGLYKVNYCLAARAKSVEYSVENLRFNYHLVKIIIRVVSNRA